MLFSIQVSKEMEYIMQKYMHFFDRNTNRKIPICRNILSRIILLYNLGLPNSVIIFLLVHSCIQTGTGLLEVVCRVTRLYSLWSCNGVVCSQRAITSRVRISRGKANTFVRFSSNSFSLMMLIPVQPSSYSPNLLALVFGFCCTLPNTRRSRILRWRLHFKRHL